MSTLAKVRCRHQKCKNLESEDTPFQKCSNCLLARYCSQECQAADWPVHKLLCVKGRVLIDEKGDVTAATETVEKMAEDFAQQQGEDVAQEQQQEQQQPETTNATTAAANNTEPVYLGEDVKDEDVMQQTIQRLQIETNIFYAYHYQLFKDTYKPKAKTITTTPKVTVVTGKNGKTVTIPIKKTTPQSSATTTTAPKLPPTLLFVQTEATVEEMRFQTLGPNTPQYDRCFVCYFMQASEFNEEVVKGHPNPLLRSKQFAQHLQKLLSTTDPTEHVTTVAVFGCGGVFVNNLELPPWDNVMDAVNEDHYQQTFRDNDCLEVYIDRGH